MNPNTIMGEVIDDLDAYNDYMNEIRYEVLKKFGHRVDSFGPVVKEGGLYTFEYIYEYQLNDELSMVKSLFAINKISYITFENWLKKLKRDKLIDELLLPNPKTK